MQAIKGKKTFIVSAITVIIGIVNGAGTDLTWAQILDSKALEFILGGSTAATIRDAIKTIELKLEGISK